MGILGSNPRNWCSDVLVLLCVSYSHNKHSFDIVCIAEEHWCVCVPRHFFLV